MSEEKPRKSAAEIELARREKIANRLRLVNNQLDLVGGLRCNSPEEALALLDELDEAVEECRGRIHRRHGLARGTGSTQETLGSLSTDG